jgi:hypothetical protein
MSDGPQSSRGISISFMDSFNDYSVEELRYMRTTPNATRTNAQANVQRMFNAWMTAWSYPLSAITHIALMSHLRNHTAVESDAAMDPSVAEREFRANVLGETVDRVENVLWNFYKQIERSEQEGNFHGGDVNAVIHSLVELDQVPDWMTVVVQTQLDRTFQLLVSFHDTVTDSLERRREACTPVKFVVRDEIAGDQDQEVMNWNGVMPETCVSYVAVPASLRKNLETNIDALSREFRNANSTDNDGSVAPQIWRPLVDPDRYMCFGNLTTHLPQFAVDRRNAPSLEERVHRITGRIGSIAKDTDHGWIPVDVKFDAQGRAELLSYMNNLHPRHHSGLYFSITDAITAFRPLFDCQVLLAPPPSLSSGYRNMY